MTLSDIGSRVSTLLRQTPGSLGLYTSAELSASINDAQMLFCIDTLALKNTGSVQTVAGVYQYALSASYMCPKLMSVYKVTYDGNVINPSPREDSMWSYANKIQGMTGAPSRYRIANGFIEVDATPNDAKDLSVWHAYTPDTLVDAASVPQIPNFAHICLVYLAAAILSYKDEKEMRKSSFYNMYKTYQARFESLDNGFDSGDRIMLDQAVANTRRHKAW